MDALVEATSWAARMRQLVAILPPIPAKAFGAAIPLALTSNFRQREEPWHLYGRQELMLRWACVDAQEDCYAMVRASLWLWASGQRARAWWALREMEAMMLDTKSA